MEYSEDDYLMISGIQHFKFCRRQWDLIHIEQQWAENVHTVTGELMHKKVHDPTLREKRKDVIIARALPVSSRELGISGECDLVEFHKCEDGIKLHGLTVTQVNGYVTLNWSAVSRYRKEQYFTVRQEGAKLWRLQKNCAMK